MKSNFFPLCFFFLLYIRILCHSICRPYVVVDFMAVCTEGVKMFVLTAINNLKIDLIFVCPCIVNMMLYL